MAVRISIIEQRGLFCLIGCTSLGYAVVEARGGQVYSLDGETRRRPEDSEAGMADVVGADGWRGQRAARKRFERLVQTGVRYAEKIW